MDNGCGRVGHPLEMDPIPYDGMETGSRVKKHGTKRKERAVEEPARWNTAEPTLPTPRPHPSPVTAASVYWICSSSSSRAKRITHSHWCHPIAGGGRGDQWVGSHGNMDREFWGGGGTRGTRAVGGPPAAGNHGIHPSSSPRDAKIHCRHVGK